MRTSKLVLAASAATLLLSCFCAAGYAQLPAAPGSTSSASAPAPSQAVRPQPSEPITVLPPVPEMVTDELGGLKLKRAVESYSELTLKGSELYPAAPLLGSRESKPEFVRELWQVMWRANDPIDLWIIRPRGVKKPPVVLYLYSYPSETARFRDNGYCTRIVHSGAAAVGFVSALTGHRSEHRPMRENFLNEMPEALASTVHDIQLIINYLETRDDLDTSRIGIFGQGSGGSIAILAASVEPRIKALDLLDPWGDWPHWLASEQGIKPEDRVEYLKPEFLKPLETLEPASYLPQLKTQKIRIQFDPGTGEAKEAVDRLVAAAPANAKVIRFPDSQLMFKANANGQLFAWMAAQLDAHPAPLDAQAPAGTSAAASGSSTALPPPSAPKSNP